MKKLTSRGIERYLTENYGHVKHDCDRLNDTCKVLSIRYKCRAIDMFHFIVEQKPILSLHTHSYGFNTRQGRLIREEFSNEYYD